MKQKDYALIIAGAVIGLFVAIFAGKYLFSNSASQNTVVDVVPIIQTDFKQPSSKYFNSKAIDPTQLINIGPNNSQQPFNSK